MHELSKTGCCADGHLFDGERCYHFKPVGTCLMFDGTITQSAQSTAACIVSMLYRRLLCIGSDLQPAAAPDWASKSQWLMLCLIKTDGALLGVGQQSSACFGSRNVCGASRLSAANWQLSSYRQ